VPEFDSTALFAAQRDVERAANWLLYLSGLTAVLCLSVEEWWGFSQGLMYLLLSVVVRYRTSRAAAVILLLAACAACFAGLTTFGGGGSVVRSIAIATPEIALVAAVYAVWNTFRYHRVLAGRAVQRATAERYSRGV
jgi:hypothetical protein